LSHNLGVSGSVILSDPNKLSELFWNGINHVEIGELPDESSFETFLTLCKERQVSFGIHSPLYRGGSKYDLLQHVQLEPEDAWKQIEHEAREMSLAGASYILVHFPYFTHSDISHANEKIENGLKRLSRIQETYGISFVCEPKLGQQRSAAGIELLHHFPEEVWGKYGLKLCIDIGDYLLATEEQMDTYLSKWINHVGVVHLHNVQFQGEKYIWVPVHPSHEADGKYYSIEEHIRYLSSQNQNITLIFEHTPHSNPSKSFVNEGFEWVKSIVGNAPSSL
jgi:sugar phosphate isomerase/epimerase